MDYGWITLNREISKHWVYRDAEYFKAWVTILMEVNHSEQKVLIGRTLFNCERGESLNSLENWGKIFGNWSKSKTKRFLDLLKNDSMIELKNERLSTRLSVCNYGKYQDVRNATETQLKRNRNATETQLKRERATNNNVLTMETMINHENNEIQSCFSFDQFWDSYGNKSNRKKAEEKYSKVSEENRLKAKENIPLYNEHLKANPWKQKKDPCTYLNGEHWNDEYSISKPSGIISQTESDRRAGQFGGGKVSKLKIIDESHLFQ